MPRKTQTTAEALTPTEDVDLFVRNATRIDPLLLRDEYIKLPADLARMGALYAEAMEARQEAEVALDRKTARLSRAHRAALESRDARATEGAIRERLHDDQQYVDARMRVIEAEAEETRVKLTLRAVEAKRDMLISLGAHVRKEMEHSPATRQAQRDQHEDVGGGHDWSNP